MSCIEGISLVTRTKHSRGVPYIGCMCPTVVSVLVGGVSSHCGWLPGPALGRLGVLVGSSHFGQERVLIQGDLLNMVGGICLKRHLSAGLSVLSREGLWRNARVGQTVLAR